MEYRFFLVPQKRSFIFYKIVPEKDDIEKEAITIDTPFPISGEETIEFEDGTAEDSLKKAIECLCNELNLPDDSTLSFLVLKSSDKRLNREIKNVLGNRMSLVSLDYLMRRALERASKESFPLIDIYGFNYDEVNYSLKDNRLKKRPFHILGYTIPSGEKMMLYADGNGQLCPDPCNPGCSDEIHSDKTNWFCKECGMFLRNDLIPEQKDYEFAQTRIMRIVDNLKKAFPHNEILWDDTVDRYARQLERLNALIILPEIDAKDISTQINAFLSACRNSKSHAGFMNKRKMDSKNQSVNEGYKKVICAVSDVCNHIMHNKIEDCSKEITNINTNLSSIQNNIRENQIDLEKWKQLKENMNYTQVEDITLSIKPVIGIPLNQTEYQRLSIFNAANNGIATAEKNISELNDKIQFLEAQSASRKNEIIKLIYPQGICEILQRLVKESEQLL